MGYAKVILYFCIVSVQDEQYIILTDLSWLTVFLALKARAPSYPKNHHPCVANHYSLGMNCQSEWRVVRNGQDIENLHYATKTNNIPSFLWLHKAIDIFGLTRTRWCYQEFSCCWLQACCMFLLLVLLQHGIYSWIPCQPCKSWSQWRWCAQSDEGET